MKDIAKAFERTLDRVDRALGESFAGPSIVPRWGIAGFGEPALVFLLAETMRALGWECEYEQGYRDGTRRRGDLVATKRSQASLWIEAKWWWTHAKLDEVLELDRWKLEAMHGRHRPIAVVFTVDEVVPRGRNAWSVSTAEKSIQQFTPAGWELVCFSAIESKYRGTSSEERRSNEHRKDRQGVFAAAFFELLQGGRNRR